MPSLVCNELKMLLPSELATYSHFNICFITIVSLLSLHAIREVTRSVYESCDLEGDYTRQWTPKQLGGSVTVVLETGAIYYFIDSVVVNCLQGNKLKV